MRHKPISLLITGASTGIGRGLALDLAAAGHQVFVSVRKQTDADGLAGTHGVTPVLFDVSDGEAIRRACSEIDRLRDSDRAFSIVNNAGIAVAGPLEEMPIADFKHQFAINVFGALEVTQTFLPIIREKRGRIVNMSSVSGLLTSPFLGAYSASKFALEAISDALRIELAPAGVDVLLIEPGPIQTPIWDKNLSAERPVVSERYRVAVNRFERYIRNRSDSALPVERVVKAVQHALFAKRPKARQIVASWPTRLEIEIARRLPSRWVDRSIVNRLFR